MISCVSGGALPVAITQSRWKKRRKDVRYSLENGAFMRTGIIVAGVLGLGLCGCRPAADGQGKAELVADVESIQPGTPFMAGVLIRVPEHWHTYWRNPGDSGGPPEMDWQLPEGFTAGPVLWPAPRAFEEPPLTSFGYENKVLLFREIRPPVNLATGSDAVLGVKITWLVCRDVCLTETAQLRLAIPVRSDPPAKSAQWRGVFERARQALPQHDPQWTFRAGAERNDIFLCAKPGPDLAAGGLAGARFFPSEPNLVEYGLQTWLESQGEYCLRMKRISADGPLPGRMEGVLVLPGGKEDGAIAVDVAIESTRKGEP